MIKLLFVGRRAGGRTRSAAQRHLACVHGRMVVLPPPGAGAMPAAYTQHHVIDGAYPVGGGPYAIERDLVTEFWFDSFDHLRESVATDYYLSRLATDEPRFVDRATVEKLRVAPHVLREGERGDYKLLLMLSRRSADDWETGLEQTAVTLAEAGFGAVQVNDAEESPMGAPFVDTVIEAWHVERTTVLAHCDRWTELPIAAQADPDRSMALAAEVFTTERLRSMSEADAATLRLLQT